MAGQARMQREATDLQKSPPAGVYVWLPGTSVMELNASLDGPEGTPFEGGTFYLTISIPQRYPFEPPLVHYTTPIYHPNIDSEGRICLDLLKTPPNGAWRPSFNLRTVLQSIFQLMEEPNPEDPLEAEIADEFKRSRASYEEKAQHYTRKYAMGEPTNGSAARLIGDAADKENLEPNDDDPPPARKLRKLAK